MDMQNKKELMKGFITAANLLPDRLWQLVFCLPQKSQIYAEEFRMRAGKPFEITVSGRPVRMSGKESETTNEDIENVLAKATRCSIHSFENDLANGFITAEGGHRIGICGTMAVSPDGKTRIAGYSSLDIRIARQHLENGRSIAERINKPDNNILILAAPGTGKTTLLRDLCRIFSAELRVSIADCRFEIGGTAAGKPIFDLGFCDVMQGGSLRKSISLLLRTMSPELIAVDEITSHDDIEAMCEAAYTGCRLMASAHGSSLYDLERRPLYRKLIEKGIFDTVILLERCENIRICRIYERSPNDKNNWIGDDNSFVLGDGNIYE